MLQGRAVEGSLLQIFDGAVSRVFQREGLNADPVLRLPPLAKVCAIRHPYIAGFLSGRLRLSGREILSYVSDALRVAAQIMPKADGQATGPLGSPSRTGGAAGEWSSTIIVDYQNSIVVPTLDDGREWLSNYEEVHLDEILSEMNAALRNMAEVSQSAWTFVNCYVWNLSVRKNIERPSRFGTYTFPTLPGFVLVCNPNAEAVDRFLIEETFLHEAIHCFVDWAEANGPEILSADGPNKGFVKSPWTGNPLDIHTAFHATLVWFGLGEYFKKCLEIGLSDAHVSRFSQRLEFIEKGFRSKDFELLMSPLIAACNEGPADILRLISRRQAP